MKKQKIYLAVLLILAGCYSPTANLYNSEKTEGVDYKKYKTYAWLPTKDTAYTQLVERQRVAAALAYVVRDLWWVANRSAARSPQAHTASTRASPAP